MQQVAVDIFLQGFWQSRTGDDSWLTPGFPSVPAFCFQPVFCSCCRCAPVRGWKWYHSVTSPVWHSSYGLKSQTCPPQKALHTLNTQKLEQISPFIFPKGTCKEINAISLTVCQFKAVCCDNVRCIQESGGVIVFPPRTSHLLRPWHRCLSLSLAHTVNITWPSVLCLKSSLIPWSPSQHNLNHLQPTYVNQCNLTLSFSVSLCLSLRHKRNKTKSRTRRLQISLSERWSLCQIDLYELLLWIRSSTLARWICYLFYCLPYTNWEPWTRPLRPLHWSQHTAKCIVGWSWTVFNES